MSDTTGHGSASLYEVVGPHFLVALVTRFYQGVATDPVLAPLYPAEDMDGARARLAGFLTQYWGGPDDYSALRGHPRLRMRHAPFAIGAEERERWLVHMRAAVAATELPGLPRQDADEVRRVLLEYFERAASAMQNRP